MGRDAPQLEVLDHLARELLEDLFAQPERVAADVLEGHELDDVSLGPVAGDVPQKRPVRVQGIHLPEVGRSHALWLGQVSCRVV